MSDGRTSDDDVAWLTPIESDAWVGLFGIAMKLPGLLDTQLQRDSSLSSFEYSVLGRLSMTEGRTLRMSELASLANGSLSRLSNVVKRLETEGFLIREPDPDDGRYTVARLTEAGWDAVVAAAPGHVQHVRRLIFDALTPTQVRQLAEIGRTIDDRLRECPTPKC